MTVRPGKNNGRKIFVSAGEASGDLHGSSLVKALRTLEPGVRIACLGGPLMENAGARVLVSNREIAVVGLFEVARHIKEIWKAWSVIRDYILRERPDPLVLIDFPDFNFLLARLAKRHGLRVFYYISPQVWGWRTGRVRTIRKLVDRMAVILPFEEEFYRRHQFKVHYVGHPLMDLMGGVPSRNEARLRYRADAPGPVVGLLPGSRRGEIQSLLPILLETAAILHEHHSGLSFLVPVAPGIPREAIEEKVSHVTFPIRVVSSDTYGVIRACDLVIAASGTVTLETAILGTPLILLYRLSDLTFSVGKLFVRVPWAGLPNLIAGKAIVPEFIQDQAKPQLIAEAALGFLNDPERREEQRRQFDSVRRRLGEPGVAERVAKLILEL